MNLGIISRNIGIALTFTAAFMGLSAVVSALSGYDDSFAPLLLSAFITAMFGLFPLVFVRKKGDITTGECVYIMFFSWLFSCIFGMLPFILWGGEMSVADAWFESTSGITTTGATCVSDLDSMPRGLLFWRSSMHFIGGLGVVVFMMMILPSSGTSRFKMSQLEIMDVSRSGYHYASNKFVRVLVTVYLAITVSAIILLYWAGMSFFDAVNHAMSVVATGGFSTRDASIAAFNSPLIEFILAVFMIVSSLHYGLIYSSFTTRSLKVLKNPVTKFYLSTILLLGVLISLSLYFGDKVEGFFNSFRVGFFELVSTISTTGFAIADTNGWPVFATLLLMYAAIQCGCSGSTTSGIRSDRVWILYHASKVHLLKKAYPNSVMQVKVGGVTISNELLSSVSLFVIIYLFTILVCALIYSLFGFNLLESLSVSVAMMSNLGPAFGSVGTMSNFSAVPEVAKILMGLQMILGRLGIYSVLLLIPMFNRR